MKISAPINRNVRVQVYEPRQTPEQEEVIVDEFELKAGAEEDYVLRSATAAYRFLDSQRVDPGAEPTLAERRETMIKEDEQRLKEVQPAFSISNVDEETKTGQKTVKG